MIAGSYTTQTDASNSTTLNPRPLPTSVLIRRCRGALRPCAAQVGGRFAGSRDDQPRLQDARTRVGIPSSKRHALSGSGHRRGSSGGRGSAGVALVGRGQRGDPPRRFRLVRTPRRLKSVGILRRPPWGGDPGEVGGDPLEGFYPHWLNRLLTSYMTEHVSTRHTQEMYMT